jgi:3-deoxy-D-manno-octulosonate 8-phosphate phosphatase (KDO 8-P phosphatase)
MSEVRAFASIPAAVARAVRLIVLDVDGVQTDGGLYIGALAEGSTVELKRFHITDGLGVKLLQKAGISVVFLSGRSSQANRIRATDLGVACYEGPGGNKLEIVERVAAEQSVAWPEIACVCDDLADLPILRRAGLGVAVANAVAEVRAAAHWVTHTPGGSGAVREFAEALLRARGEWSAQVDGYVNERGG